MYDTTRLTVGKARFVFGQGTAGFSQIDFLAGQKGGGSRALENGDDVMIRYAYSSYEQSNVILHIEKIPVQATEP